MSHLTREDPWLGYESAVLSPGYVVAWRRWRLRPDESGAPLLASVHGDHVWLAQTVCAECDPSRTWAYRMALDGGDEGEHQAPAVGCRCGMYAYRTPELARPMGPGVWVHGRVLLGGPMFATDSGYRAREATIDSPFGLVIECVGGDDLVSPIRCFEPPARIKRGPKAYYPICGLHLQAPVGAVASGSNDLLEFIDAVSLLAGRLNTRIAAPTAT